MPETNTANLTHAYLTDSQIVLLIDALRFYQVNETDSVAAEQGDEIDDLCEYLNCGGGEGGA